MDYVYYVDYTADTLAVLKVTAGHSVPELAANTKRAGIAAEIDVDALSRDLQIRLYDHLFGSAIEFLTETSVAESWAKLAELEVTPTEPANQPEGDPQTVKLERKKRERKAKIISDQNPLQTDQEQATSSTSGDGAAPENKDVTMSDVAGTAKGKGGKAKGKKAAKKKSAKKKAAKKAVTKTGKPKTEGVPKEGTKKFALLKVLRKPGGATMAEMLKVTGWKACLGTAKEVAVKAGLKFAIVKAEGNANRWEATGKLKGE